MAEQVCRWCGESKSEHGVLQRKELGKPLGIDTVVYVCQKPLHSSAIRLFEPAEPSTPTAEPQPDHVCGLEGYGAPGDTCLACEWSRKRAERGNQPQVCSECGRSNTFITMASTAMGNCGKCGMPIVAAGPATPPTGVEKVIPEKDWPQHIAEMFPEASASVGDDHLFNKAIEGILNYAATLQAERDRLRDELEQAKSSNWANRRRADSAEGQLTRSESQLAEARKLEGDIDEIAGYLKNESTGMGQRVLQALSYIAGVKIRLAVLSQPTNPPAVPSEEDIAEVLAKWSSEGQLTLMEHPPTERESLLAAARAVLALLKGENGQ